MLAAVFKTVEPYGKHTVGGFDSHALPPFFSCAKFAESLTANRPLSFGKKARRRQPNC